MQTGIYSYQRRRFDGSFDRFRMKVEIVEEGEKTCVVRFLEFHADGRAFGSLSRVYKRNLRTTGAAKPHSSERGSSYLPYKD